MGCLFAVLLDWWVCQCVSCLGGWLVGWLVGWLGGWVVGGVGRWVGG